MWVQFFRQELDELVKLIYSRLRGVNFSLNCS